MIFIHQSDHQIGYIYYMGLCNQIGYFCCLKIPGLFCLDHVNSPRLECYGCCMKKIMLRIPVSFWGKIQIISWKISILVVLVKNHQYSLVGESMFQNPLGTLSLLVPWILNITHHHSLIPINHIEKSPKITKISFHVWPKITIKYHKITINHH